MAITFSCQNCQKRFSLKNELAGKKGKCPCGTVFRIPSADPPVVTPIQPLTSLDPVQVTNPLSSHDPYPVAIPEPIDDPLFSIGSPDPFAIPSNQTVPAIQPRFQESKLPPIQGTGVLVLCASCGNSFLAADDAVGQYVQCNCGSHVFVPDPLGNPLPNNQMPEPYNVLHEETMQATNGQIPNISGVGIQVPCACGNVIIAPPQMRGQQMACSCGAYVLVNDAPAMNVPAFNAPTMNAHPGGGFPPATNPQTVQQKRRKSEDKLLAQYESKDAWRKPSQQSGGAFEFEKNSVDYGVIGGIAMIAVAIIWFVVGLAFGIIFFYPPILLILGVIALIKGILD